MDINGNMRKEVFDVHVKTIAVRNPKNVLVQIPGFIVDNWGLAEGDLLEMHIHDDRRIVIIPKREGLNRSSSEVAK